MIWITEKESEKLKKTGTKFISQKESKKVNVKNLERWKI